MIHLLLFLVALLSFGALMAGLPRHQGPLLHRMLPIQPSKRLRVVGWIGLALGYGLAMLAFGGGYGTLVWLGACTLGLLAVILLLAFRTQARRHPR
ncbi:DUF3325 domain-containing protein [Sphingomonas sp. PL-96]|uniref:DUF3325 domain-containing protein n=1 Tax=Sphingomonas sp. PL-96 TaxID=2887201 RepID=UPI001E581DD6|nr:DUF3325 domain-containing protein [Sphingomonas sp. PL-96]MCC2976802.1 DUF3325 domain-containing protein [Sphingomonas sp. PL-96]